jgi:predicted nucleic acid-binding protein
MPSPVSIVPPEVFVDSAGFIALHVPQDTHHQAAVSCRDQFLRYSHLYTSAAVISETIAHIQRDRLLDQQSLDDLIGDFLTPKKWISLLPVDEEVVRVSLKKVKERLDRRFSFVDASNIVLMEKNRIDMIFTFDALYDGVQILRGHNPSFIQRIPT